ncbi:thiol:disulfide interchange protein DsbA/DsbL [Parahaliea sp. F7430]|uniref:Thiol:disulfide interchange protein n=1 Tax=Sediminihaliea albiluteola TaxID=2758564 RepID=A0A7W2YKX4_9GAMM|nr:thiol:disulfide interchange protein DsbA/DsbL [Sediminihaliea albiluteola]MBA6413823.1 thiol:disulfide interchange protein DsbA/DsbL [Sediminihaliea albiluteola]
MLKKLIVALSLTVLMPLSAVAQEWREGEHYDLITPSVRTANSNKIEVVEFFWYGCGHCYNFEPMVSQWKKTLADDVEAHGSPAVWNKGMELHAKAYYTAQVLGVLETMHPVLFQAMNVDRKRLASDDEIKALFTANGVSAEDFDKVYSSFGINSQVRQANSRARAAKITGTPEMMVNGKYRISTRKAGSQANMLKIADYLIEKERASASQKQS